MDIDEDDAALIDSFFLPGGILDPDEDGQGDIPAVTSFEDARVSRIPRNPWSGDSIRDGAGESEPTLQHLAITPHVTKSASTCLRPPPGYSANDLHRQKSTSFFSTETRLFSPHSSPSAAVTNTAFSSDEYILGQPLPPPGLLQPTSSGYRQVNLHTKETNAGCLETKQIPSLSGSLQMARLQNRVILETKKATLSEPSTPSPPILKQTSDSTSVKAPNVSNLDSTPIISIPSQKTQIRSEVNGEHRKQGHDIVDGVVLEEMTTPSLSVEIHKAKEEQEENMISEKPGPFPMQMLTLEDIDKRESAASSLSSSSNGSMEHDESQKTIVNERFEVGEEHTKAPDAGATMKKNSPNMMKQVSCQAFISDTDSQPSKGKKCDEAVQNAIQTVKEEDLHGDRPCHYFFVAAISCCEAIARATASIFDSKLPNTIEQMRQGTQGRLRVFNQTLFSYSTWILDIKEVIAVLLSRLVNSIMFLVVVASKLLAVSLLMTVQSWMYSLIEVFEELNVAVCYIIFYCMPTFCSILMRYFTLPHWTPHLVASLVVGSLCNQTQPGPLHYRLPALLEISKLVSSKQAISLETEFRPRDSRACRSILRLLRFVLPVFFLADGFSNDFGTIMGIQGASRLTTAYVMILVRKNFISSPVGWGSWALQVLFSTYCSWSSLDAIVLVLGLSSIRLIRYLEVRRLKDGSKSNGRDSSW